jgi:hypothetical protein
MRIEIVKTRPRHVVDLVSNMRADDAAELSMLGASPREAWNQYSHSVLSRTLEIDGRVAVVWGQVGGWDVASQPVQVADVGWEVCWPGVCDW